MQRQASTTEKKHHNISHSRTPKLPLNNLVPVATCIERGRFVCGPRRSNNLEEEAPGAAASNRNDCSRFVNVNEPQMPIFYVNA